MRRSFRKPAAVTALAIILVLTLAVLPILAAPVVKDVAAGDEDSYMYGANDYETLTHVSTATGDVNNDGLPDLIMGHDQGGTALPYLYTGKVYVYYGRSNIAPNVDLGTGADVIINGKYFSFTGNSVACGDVNGDNIDDILIGAYYDNPGDNVLAGGVAVILGRNDLETHSPWDFNTTLPDLYISSANAGELCGSSVAAGDIDGDNIDDILFGAPLANGGVHFNDGGAAWTAQGRAGADSLMDVSMYSPSPGNYRGWAVGRYVSVYTTLYFYNGTSWSTKTTGLPNLQRDFYGVSSAYYTAHAWSVGDGGIILRTNDGGTNWNTQTSGTTANLTSVSAVDSNTAWSVGDNGTILKTINGGTNWNTQTSGTTANLTSVSAVDSNTAWAAVDDGAVLRTTDGSSWVPSTSFAQYKNAVDAYDSTHVWAVGAQGTIAFWDNTSWANQTSGVTSALRDVSNPNASNVWTVGDAGTILKTSDGGANWGTQTSGTTANLNGVTAIDNKNVWAVGDGGTITNTSDGGANWGAQTSGTTANIRDISVIGINFSWAVGAQGTIAFWNNTTWATQTSGVSTALRDVAALDASNVWAVGDGGVIRKTGDGGASWGPQASGTTANLNGVAVVDANNAWAVGDGGTILYFNGTSWSDQSYGTDNLMSVSAADSTHVWAVGEDGTILYYNGSWGDQSTGTTDLRGVSAASTTTAWAVGDNGTVLKTTDGGTNWNPESVLFSQTKNAVDAFDATHVWAVGEAASGRGYIVWGGSTWPAPAPDYYTNPIRPDRVINGIDPFDYCGQPVSAGNLNGDSYDDLVIGSYEANGPNNARNGCGEAYVVNGRARGSFPTSIDLSTGSNCTVYGQRVMDRMPTSMPRPLEDLNGDGRDDLILGDIFADGPNDSRGGCGDVYVIYGGSLPAIYDLASKPADISVYGPASGDGAGLDVTVLDFDADGHMDLATGGASAGKGAERPNCGAAWLAPGSASWPSQVDLATQAGMVFYGAESNDAFGYSLTSANLDGDPGGYEDLVISDLNGDGPGNTLSDCGEHFVFLGYDYVLPTCSITNVADGAVLAGTVGVRVDASDVHGIDRVEFRVDGILTHTDTTAPYRWDWDTQQYVDGETYTLEARAYDNSGNSASDSRDVRMNNTIPPVSDTWYLAEGTTAYGFEEYVLVQNPNAEAVDVTFTFMKPGGETQNAVFPLAENSRFTILVNSFVPESDVSTQVVGSRPIICERAMYWTPQGQASRIGGHDSIGITETSPTWYLAEGTTAFGFEEYVLVQNPNAEAVDVTMTFMKPGGATQTLAFPVAGQARYTVNVNEVVPESDVSTRVEATAPVICERSMYRNGKDLGHDSIGTPTTSREWYLAEGTTAWGFDEYVLVQNPGTQQAAVGLEFMLPDGSVVPYGILVPGESRYTIHVNEVPGCEETDLSTFVSSSEPVICERAMYWQGATSAGGHDTIGTPLPSTAWYLAEGTTAWGFEEYVLVQNPNHAAAVVSFTFMKPDATTEFISFPVAGNSRFSLRANDVVPDSDVSVSVLADKPVICERAMYWGQRDVGHVTIGVRGE